jgi:DNA-binding CsgD family transcriptional regulator
MTHLAWEVYVWFHRRPRPARPPVPAPQVQASRPGSLPKDALSAAQGTVGDQLAFEIDGELSTQLSLAAHSRGQTVGGLIADLIARGLQQDTLRSQAEAALASLTPREQEVAWLTVRGYTNPQIAEALIVSPETVKTHVAHVLEKFGVRSKTELRVRLLDLGVRWWEADRR